MSIENKHNLCDGDGNCTVPDEPLKQKDCAYYGSTSYHLCSHLAWEGSCLNDEAFYEAQGME
jgi:hypothetical protein